MKFLMLTMLFIFTSCASYVDSLHRQMDGRKAKKKKPDQFSMYRDRKPLDPNQRVTLSNLAPEQASFEPKIKRQYKPMNRRFQAQDFVDQDNSGSLWASESADGYLFSRDAHKKPGDIIVMKVQGKLKNEITSELKRAFPAPKKKKKAKPAGDKNKDPNAKPEEAVAQNNEEKEVAEDAKIYDQISSLVAEEVNKDYVLLRGQKEVIFRSNKHLIEVQALVPRKDIAEDDTIMSAVILESNVTVLR